MTKKLLLSTVTSIVLFGLIGITNAQSEKLHISEDNVVYDCPDGQVTAPENLNIDMESTSIIDDRFFKDKNKVYTVSENWKARICTFYILDNIDPESFVIFNDYYQKDNNNIYYSDNYWGFGTPQIIEGADINTFTVLNDWYAKDKNYAYYTRLTDHEKITMADVGTFEVLSEDGSYAMDKNNMYLYGKVLNEAADKITDKSLYQNLKGKVLLKVEANGEAYYVHPTKQEMHYLSRPLVAFYVMREQGIGITDGDLEKIEIAIDNISGTDSDGDKLSDMLEDSLGTNKYKMDSDGDGFNDKEEVVNGYNPANSKKLNLDSGFARAQAGKIFLQVEKNGEAWYVNPINYKRYFLGRPIDAFNLMRDLGLGISDANFEKMINNDTNWKIFKSTEKQIYYETDDWSSYSPQDSANKVQIAFEYPGSWSFTGTSVFDDETGSKIAELLPGAILLSNNQNCFDSPHDDNFGMSKLISKENFTIENNSGVKKITKTNTNNGTWYPNLYCIQKENKAFVIALYETNLNSERQHTFEKIISSFKFLN